MIPIQPPLAPWSLPSFDSGGLLVAFEKLREISSDEESLRSMHQ